MRGTQTSGRNLWNGGRIIPAYAGNTANTLINGASARDHPRVCGEHILLMQSINGQTGSSPRMRGTLDVRVCAVSLWGIIPAYAGNTTLARIFREALGDHPRVCGEHLWYCPHGQRYEGSSPRMRGTLSLRSARKMRQGIIPAYAGNTISAASCICSSRDHPRVCGEHMNVNVDIDNATGSSPRMRGTHAQYRYDGY